MKIFFNTYPAAFQCPGGGEIQLLKSKEALERRGHEIILFDQWKHDLKLADVVHQFSVQGGAYNLCAYAHHNQIPLILSPILWLAEYIDQYPMSEIEYMTNIANIICPNSYAEMYKFLKYFNSSEDKYFVTHNGVDDIFFEPISPNVFLETYSINFPFILSVGNIEIRKNQLALVEACTKVGLHTVLVGHIRDKEYFQLLNTRFKDKFSYLGHLSHGSPVLRSAYAACLAFALPSLLETPGLAALEAAASGVPLVVTQEGSTNEYFGEYAYYVNPKSIEDIASKLRLAINNKKRDKILKDHVSQFSWDRVAIELENAYLKAINSVRLRK